MKKLLLTGSALLVLAFANAQTAGVTATGVYDDFEQEGFYFNPALDSLGMIWWSGDDKVFTIARPGTEAMEITAVNAGGGASSYPLFGLDFNKGLTVDFSGGADITIDIENTSLTDDLIMDITLEDVNGKKATREPNVSDVTSNLAWGDAPYPRKALNGFTLAADTRSTITIDLSSVPGAIGGLTEDWSGCDAASKPANCPATSYTLDASKIKAILFRVNAGLGDYPISQGDGNYAADENIAANSVDPYNGVIKIHSFKMGSNVTGVDKSLSANAIGLYPNPAKEKLNVSFNNEIATEVSLNDIFGNAVYTAVVSAGAKYTTVNTSGLTSGMYILNVATSNGTISRKVIIE